MGTCSETIGKHRILFPSIQHLAWLAGNKDVVKIAIFGLTHWLKHRITRKLLKIDAARGLASTELSFHPCNILRDNRRDVSRGNKNVGCGTYVKTAIFFNCCKLHNFCCHNRFSCLITVCSICTWTSCLRILTKSPAIPQQLYKPASRGLSAIAELLVTYRNNLMWIITKIRNPWHSVKLNYVVVAYFNSSIGYFESNLSELFFHFHLLRFTSSTSLHGWRQSWTISETAAATT